MERQKSSFDSCVAGDTEVCFAAFSSPETGAVADEPADPMVDEIYCRICNCPRQMDQLPVLSGIKLEFCGFWGYPQHNLEIFAKTKDFLWPV